MSRLRTTLFLAWKDFHYLVIQKETLVWMFVMPFVFFFFIGTITGGFGGGPPSGETLALRAPEGGVLLPAIEERLERLGYTPVVTESDTAFARYTRRLSFPPAFSDSVLAGTAAEVRYEREGDSALAGQYDDIRIQRALYETLADVVLAAGEEGAPTADRFLERARRAPLIFLSVSEAGSRRQVPDGFQQAVPGTMVMFILLVVFTSGAHMLVTERKQGSLKRLAASPVDRGEVVAAKTLSRLVMGAVQIVLALAAGHVLFRVSWGAQVPALVGVLLVYAAVCAMMGVVLGSLVRTQGQAIGIGILLTNVLAALGGCWWPIEVTPQWMQDLAMTLPTGWAMDAVHRLTSFGDPASAVLPHVGLMLAALAVLLVVGHRTFRFAD